MVPDKFNMVDMEGIDLIESQGVAIEGLYQKLVESITLCRYQCIYNWKFNGILIPPSYVEMEVHEDGVWINEGVNVDEEDVIHIYSIEPEPPAPIVPEIQPLTVAENGEYYAPVGVDGYNPVTVSVPPNVPVLDELNVTANGTYTPPTGVDGFNEVTVSVPSGSVPQLQFHRGRLTVNTGEIAESDEYCYSDLIPITTGNGQWFLDLARTDMGSYYLGVCMYESDGQTYAGYVRQYQAYRSYQSSGIGTARYMRIATKVENLSFAALAFVTDNIYITGTQSVIKKANL